MYQLKHSEITFPWIAEKYKSMVYFYWLTYPGTLEKCNRIVSIHP